MQIIKFLTSKVFFKQLVLAVLAVVLLCFFILLWLKSYTNHGDFVKVPNLKGKALDIVEKELKEKGLTLKVQDSANYNPKYPKHSVINQLPLADASVKENRKIYVVLNPSGYKKVEVPNIIRRTIRQAKPRLEALGFVVGDITYVDDIGKDEVVRIMHKGKSIDPGLMLEKTTTIDLVLGNGQRNNN